MHADDVRRVLVIGSGTMGAIKGRLDAW